MRRRSKARQYALQMLYCIDITGEPYSQVMNKFYQEKNLNPSVKNFSSELVKGTSENLTEIDSILSNHSENWDIERMSVVDRNILRMAIYELVYKKDTPPLVVIDEAIELSNRFSNPESGRFINGVLDSIMNTYRKDELEKQLC